MKVDSVLGLSRYRGSQSKNAPYAEAFEVFRMTERVNPPVARNGKANAKAFMH
jgi:hypothetical protein